MFRNRILMALMGLGAGWRDLYHWPLPIVLAGWEYYPVSDLRYEVVTMVKKACEGYEKQDSKRFMGKCFPIGIQKLGLCLLIFMLVSRIVTPQFVLHKTEVMSPQDITDSSLTTGTMSALGMVKHDEKGTNWATYKETMLANIDARGLYRHLKGLVTKPEEFTYHNDGSVTKADGTTATKKDISSNEELYDTNFLSSSTVTYESIGKPLLPDDLVTRIYDKYAN
ncbi:hypothetical protein SERLA73DRAFT_156136 [Serpula lacrymans var. lacrymans S7.3]|uniref:Uncharacterized protein n=1 Tax=Serpula lacrymans var. lacrymans (strain S7.3) TaxID=936435 RepID=F8QD52_SERL3|nr:hypothetical protein SERLA73DRAFT_156136 [Serpula lacrymans var. lacrymans S7.3]